ncbi:MAG: TetR/AcrR family transcriptional regulator [Thermotaleaceae bacterium]
MTVIKDRRMDILQAALHIFSKKGYHNAKIEDIAMEAGIAKGTIYQYFSSKQDLFQQMFRHGVERYGQSLQEIATNESHIRDKLLALAQSHGKFLEEHIGMSEIMPKESKLMSKEMRCWVLEQRDHAFSSLEEMIEQGIALGEVREDTDKGVAVLAIIGSLFAYYEKESRNKEMKFEEISPMPWVDFILRALQ